MERIEKEIIDEYQSGTNAYDTSRMLQTTTKKVYGVLKKHGIEKRERTTREEINRGTPEVKINSMQERKRNCPVEIIDGERYRVVNEELEYFG